MQTIPRTDLSESLVADVAALATAKGRMVGTPGHKRARAYLVERLESLKLVPYGTSFELPYSVDGHRLCNVVAIAPGRQGRLPPIVLAAHYDTCGPLPGADDNAAAVAIALQVAEQLTRRPLQRDVVIGLFDGEEPPYSFTDAMGSVYWYRHQRQTPVHCAVVLDLVGHDVPIPGLEDLLFVTGMESDPDLALRDLSRPNLRVQPILNSYVGDLSDHHIFRVHQRPFLFFSCARWEHYHARTDTPDKLNYRKMGRIAELLGSLLPRVDNMALAGPFDSGDTLPVELAAASRHFGAKIDDRAGMDAFVKMAMSSFGL